MILRVRSNVGVWRVELPADEGSSSSCTPADVYNKIKESRPHVVYEQPLSRDPACREPLDETASLASQGLGQNGAMVHCRVDPASTIDITAKNIPSNEDDSQAEAIAAPTTSAAGAASSSNLHMRRVIGKDGSIQLVPTSEAPAAGSDRGFRKGMLPLRDMKMHWTREYYFYYCFIAMYFYMCIYIECILLCLCLID